VDADVPEIPPLDLSKATKLKDVQFRCGTPEIQWITMALGSIESKNLQQIFIHFYPIFTIYIGEMAYQDWGDLDRVLVQFWTSHSIRPKIKYDAGREWNNLNSLAPSLLPELTRRQVVDLLEE
jgi:hypothetical protein